MRVSFNELSRSLSRIDSWFTRLSQVLARDKSSLGDGKEDLRYAVRKINQHFYAGTVPRFDGCCSRMCALLSLSVEKPTADLIARNASIVVDLLLSVHNGSDDFEFLAQVLNLVREILDCDKSMCQKQIICQDRSDLQPRERPMVAESKRRCHIDG